MKKEGKSDYKTGREASEEASLQLNLALQPPKLRDILWKRQPLLSQAVNYDEYFLACTTLAFLTLGITVICIYLYKFYNIFVQMLSHRTEAFSSPPPQRQPLSAPSPLLLCGPLPSCWMTGPVLRLSLSVLLAGLSCLVFTSFYFFWFLFYFSEAHATTSS